jgi:hypothetical protein
MTLVALGKLLIFNCLIFNPSVPYLCLMTAVVG